MSGKRIQKVVVVGAGMAGLAASRRLKAEGREVVVLDKARGVGGRMASRRIGPAVCDHGAQYFTSRDPRFLRALGRWLQAGVAVEWPGWPVPGDVRYRGVAGMTSIPRHLAEGLDVRLGERVLSVARSPGGWLLRTESGASLAADAVVLTAPVPQSLAMLDAGGADLPAETRGALEAIRYDSCFTALAVLDGPSAVPPPGAVSLKDGPIGFVSDNRSKGISPDATALTVQASAEFSREHLDEDPGQVGRHLLDLAKEWFGSSRVLETGFHRWLYSRPIATGLPPSLVIDEAAPLVIAGDAFGGPRVEGAALSGFAAARWFELEE